MCCVDSLARDVFTHLPHCLALQSYRWPGAAAGTPQHTLGGYTDKFVVHEHFGVRIPLDCASSLFGAVCANARVLAFFLVSKTNMIAVVVVAWACERQ